MVRERPVRLEVAADGLDREPLEHRRQHHARHPVRGVDHHLQRLDRVDVDEGEHFLDEPRPDVLRRHRTAPGWRTERLQRAVAHVEQARLAAHRKRAAADDLHARVLLRVVRGGDADAALELELPDRVVDHLGADQTEVEHVGAAVGRALDQGRGHRRRGEPRVAADRDAARLEVLDVGAADRVRALLVQLVLIDAAHVVRLEGLGIEHEPDAMGTAFAPAVYPLHTSRDEDEAPRRRNRGRGPRVAGRAGLLAGDRAGPRLHGRLREQHRRALRPADARAQRVAHPAGRERKQLGVVAGAAVSRRRELPAAADCRSRWRRMRRRLARRGSLREVASLAL